MNPDLDILATTLYVTVDDLLIRNPHSVSNATADAPEPVSAYAYCNAYSPSPRSSGTTKPPTGLARPAP